MDNLGDRRKIDFESLLFNSITPIDFFSIHEDFFIQGSDPVNDTFWDENCSCRNPIDFLVFLVKAVVIEMIRFENCSSGKIVDKAHPPEDLGQVRKEANRLLNRSIFA